MENTVNYSPDVARIMQDPVLWAEHHLGQKPRWYQEQILRHPHNRIVLRCGRRLGKCIAEDQRILDTRTGRYETIKTLYGKQQVTTATLNNQFKIEEDVSFRIEENGIKPTFEITAKHGAQVTLTGNHPVLTLEGWKEVDMLKLGDSIAVPKRLPFFGKEAPGFARAKMIGYLIGARKVTVAGPTLQLNNEDTRQIILDTAKDAGLSLFPKSAKTHFIVDKQKIFKGILDLEDDAMPKEIFEYDKKHLAVFLAALYDAKGWFYGNRIAEIGFGSKNRLFLKDLKHLLLRFGVDVNIIERKVRGEEYFHAMLYAKKDIRMFLNEIAIYGVKDYSEMQRKISQMEERSPSIPKEIWEHVETKRKEKGLKKKEVTGSAEEKFRTNIGLTEDKAVRYAQNLEDPYLYDLATSDILWEEITNIRFVKDQMTYDVFMPTHHNLVVEDILVHNTWTMTAHMLWAAFTNMGGKKTDGPVTCLVATPYDNQARLIFDELRKFIEESDVLKQSVKTITKAPYYIEFKNGAKIKLFTAGTRTGSSGASLRGQHADFLYLDKILSLLPVKVIE